MTDISIDSVTMLAIWKNNRQPGSGWGRGAGNPDNRQRVGGGRGAEARLKS